MDTQDLMVHCVKEPGRIFECDTQKKELEALRAKPMIRIDAIVLLFCWSAACFYVGVLVGEEQSAVELMPCPKEDGMSITSRTATSCTYQKVYGRALTTRKL